MPTSSSFAAAGVFNGFPRQVPKIDANGAFSGPNQDWVTLGGTRKGSTPTQSEIDLSLRNAVKIFWAFTGITGSTASRGVSISNVTFESIFAGGYSKRDAKIQEIGPDFDIYTLSGGDADVSMFTPINRSNKFSFEAIADNSADDGQEVDFAGIILLRTTAIGGSTTPPGAKIWRMYDGDTTNEANFVGYGVYELCSLRGSYVDRGVSEDRSLVELSSWNIPAGPSPDLDGYAETTVSGIPIMCHASTDNSTGTINPAGLSASDGVTNASVTGLQFWDFA